MIPSGIVHYCEVLNVPYTYRGDLVTHRIKSPLTSFNVSSIGNSDLVVIERLVAFRIIGYQIPGLKH